MAVGEIEQFIRDAASVRGIDPDTVVRAFKTEGGVTEPARLGDFSGPPWFSGKSWWPPQSEVAPCPSSQDVLDGLDAGSVLASETLGADSTGRIASANLQDLILTQPRLPIGLAVRVSSLGDHVGVVVLKRPQEQMVRADARAVVAVVEDVQTIGDRATMQAPRDAVHVIADERAILSADGDVAVAGVSADALGKPAVVSLRDAAPETELEVLLSESTYGIMDVHQITPGVVPSAVSAARGLLVGILP